MRIKRVFKSNFIYAISLSIIQIVIIMMLFEPTEKSDDFDMCQYLYGAFNGKFDFHMMYCSTILGRILVFLLNINPNIPWYAVYMMTAIFLSMVGLNYFFNEYCSRAQHQKMFYFVISMALSYEFYIRFTFTKVAGLSMTVSAFLFFSSIIKNKPNKLKILTALLAFNGLIIRGNISYIVVFALILLLTLYIADNIKKISKQLLWKCFGVGLFSLILIGSYTVILKIDSYEYNKDDAWVKFVSNNNIRASLFDYGIPYYDTYKNEYTELGISENDYRMWFEKYDYGDRVKLNLSLIEDIRLIEEPAHKGLSETLKTGIKLLLPYSMKKFIFYIFLMVICNSIVRGVTNDILKIIPICILMISMYLIMYTRGRVQHHVDVVVYIIGIMAISLFTSNDKIVLREHRGRICVNLILILACGSLFSVLTNSSYYQEIYGNEFSYRDKMSRNREKLQLLSEDAESLYLLGALETSDGYAAYTVTSQIIPLKFYSNIFLLNGYFAPSYEYIINNHYGKDVPLFENIVNNEGVLYCATRDARDDSEVIAKYLDENYVPGTRAQLIKNIDGMKIYIFVDSDKPEIDYTDIKSGEKIINTNIENIGQENELYLIGEAYISGDNSFADEIYIEEYNSETDTYNYYYTLQLKSEKLNDEYNGKYSRFYIYIPQEADDNIYSVIIKASDGNMYKKTIR